jgi:peptide/nickel transport system permease protein
MRFSTHGFTMAALLTDVVEPLVGPAEIRRTRHLSLSIWIPAVILALMVAACFLGPFVFPVPNPNGGLESQALLAPFSPGHILGTDDLGNDILSRCLYGGRVSIEVGLGAVGLGLLFGTPLGMLAGYRGGTTDSLIMRFLDMFLAFPALVLALAVASYLGPNERDVIFAIGFFTVPAYARLARAATLRLGEQGFIAGAKMIGQRGRRIITHHVLPNVLPNLMTFGLLTVAIAIVVEATLDYLGAGVRPPQPSWGSLLATGQQYLSLAPWIALVPSCFLFVTVTSLNLLGDALRARLDAR